MTPSLEEVWNAVVKLAEIASTTVLVGMLIYYTLKDK